MEKSEASKPKTQKHKKTVLVRYGRMGYLGWFEHNETTISKTKTKVLVKTSRGLEMGEIVGPCCYRAGHFKCSQAQVENYYADRTKDYPLTDGGTLVHYATAEDLMEAEHLEASSREELKCCQQFADEMKLPMKIIDAEHLFGGERIVIYFTSPTRVDFRELVKKLAKEYQTRIELRQIGSRDEARIISDFESCGQECCCRRFLKILAPVNMRMAKLQKATLDPSKISGHCGRLKCCLRYEDQTYRDLKERLPKKNTLVKTSTGEGKVIDGQVLTQLVVVRYNDDKTEAVALEDIEIIGEKATPEKKTRDDNRSQSEQNNRNKKPETKKPSDKKTNEDPTGEK